MNSDKLYANETDFQNTNFISQCWLKYPEDTLLVGTDTGLIYLFRTGYIHINITLSVFLSGISFQTDLQYVLLDYISLIYFDRRI